MPFEIGNQYGVKRRIIEQALQRAIAQDRADRLRTAVEKLLDTAAFSPDASERLAAFNAIADRTDGKAIARSESVEGDVRAMTLQDVARLVMQARAVDATDAPTTSAAARQGVPAGGDTPIEAVGGEGVVAVGPTHTTSHENSPSSDSGGK